MKRREGSVVWKWSQPDCIDTLFAFFFIWADNNFGNSWFWVDNNFGKICLADNLKNVSHWGEGWGSGLGAGGLSCKGSGLTFKQGLALLCI